MASRPAVTSLPPFSGGFVTKSVGKEPRLELAFPQGWLSRASSTQFGTSDIAQRDEQ